MKDCTRYQTLRIEMELDGPDAGPAHCRDCEAETRAIVRIIRAGRALGRATPPAEAVEAGRRRLLEMLSSGGGRGLVALLAFAGGVFLAGLAAAGGTDRRAFSAEAALTMAAGTAGVAAAALAGDPGGGRGPARRSGPARVRVAPSGLARSSSRAIMRPCELSPAFS